MTHYLNFKYGLQEAYNKLGERNSDTLYFISDTQRMYKGDILIADVNNNIEFLSSSPSIEEMSENKLYIITEDGKTSIIIKSKDSIVTVGGGKASDYEDDSITFEAFNSDIISSSISDEAVPNKIVTEKAVKDYVDNIKESIENNLNSIGDTIITNVSVGEANTQNKDKIGLHFQTKKKSDIGDYYEDGNEIIIDLDKEKFLSNVKLNEDGHTLELTMNNNDIVEIDLSEILTAKVIDQKIGDAINNLDISPSFDHETGTLSIGKNNSPANLEGVVYSPEYTSNKLILKVYGRDSVEVSFDKLLDNRYISSINFYSKYPESGELSQENVIVFKYNDESSPLVLPIGFLMDKYIANNKDKNIEVTISNNEVSASLVVTNSGQTDGAIMVINKDGTLIAKSPSDAVGEAIAQAITQALEEEGKLKSALDKKLDKLANGSEGEIIISTSDGIQRSGKTIGTNKLADNPTDNVIATEGAIANLMSWGTI